MTRIFCVDAFTAIPFSGNPAAVCLPGSSMPDERMQTIAGEMNLSETAFLQRHDKIFNLRWFTPTTQVELCGHATLACAHILWETGEVSTDAEITFHTKSGAVKAVKTENGITLDFPLTEPKKTPTPAGLTSALGIKKPVAVMKAGPDFLVETSSADHVKKLQPDFTALCKIPARGIIVTANGAGTGVDFVSRFFAPSVGIDEDPVTGSAHCALAPYWRDKTGKISFTARQVSKRGGELSVCIKTGDRVAITGRAVTVWEGRLLAQGGHCGG